MGLMAAYLSTPLLAILLAMALSFVFGHKVTLRLFSVLSLFGFLLLLLVLIFFPLDVIQVRSVTPEQQLPSFHVGAVLAELKHHAVVYSNDLMMAFAKDFAAPRPFAVMILPSTTTLLQILYLHPFFLRIHTALP